MARFLGSVAKNHTSGGRETAFWILLFGSWIMLNSNAWPNQLLGAAGAAVFLALAYASLGRLQAMGMHFADWSPVSKRYWFWAAGLGAVAGATAVTAAQLAGQRIRVADNWRMLVLQVGLGPVLEEILFRGYLIRLALWALKGLKSDLTASTAAVLISAALFGGIHVLRPPIGGKDIAAIAAMGLVYGCIRMSTRSTATAAVAHGVYNATLHVGMFLSGSRLLEIS